ncbi:MAG TPA: TetR/AcrR family transcriptional regulator [Candidatus Nanopelagicales bacterium]|nr:TetR/AcrR family transcriptional regulator [Candidatus Nanopelagicales bacterium]
MAGARRRRVDTSGWPTKELILLEASRLFAVRGYLGTSTRDIATAVGIKQPSMYSHFSSKQAIAEELLRRDLVVGIDMLEKVAADGGGPAVELYRYLRWEVVHDLETPFDLRSLYLGPLLDQPEFAEGRRLLKRYDALMRSIVERGVESGDFIHVEPQFVKRVIDGVVLEAMRSGATERKVDDDEPDLTAAFLVRAMLSKPSRLDAVREAAHALGSPD